MPKPELTAERLRELLHYNPETGIFSRPINRGGEVAGAVVGCLTANGYWLIGVDYRRYRAHRLAWLYMYGNWPTRHIDHLNGNRTDNRIANLRDVDRATNMQNMRKALSTNRCGLMGVSFHRQSGLWAARLVARGKIHSLGYHRTPEAAHEAYLAAKRKLHEGCTI